MKALSYLLIPLLGLAVSVSIANPPPPITATISLNVVNHAACPFTVVSPGEGGGQACTFTHSKANGIPGNGGTETITCPAGGTLNLWYNKNKTLQNVPTSTLQFNHLLLKNQYSYFMQSYDWNANLIYSVNKIILNGPTSRILSDDGTGASSVITITNTIVVTYSGTQQEVCADSHSIPMVQPLISNYLPTALRWVNILSSLITKQVS
ncbi:MAG: hypothetical protein EXR81_02505 [Gammaproteobacteria bacterium]|nr:hypothetical protein [Gammaproteobacteria bacterium]